MFCLEIPRQKVQPWFKRPLLSVCLFLTIGYMISYHLLHDFLSPFFAYLLHLSFPAYLFVLSQDKKMGISQLESLYLSCGFSQRQRLNCLWITNQISNRIKWSIQFACCQPCRTHMHSRVSIPCDAMKPVTTFPRSLFSVYSLARVCQLRHLHKI